jgi:hypothetical protein
MGSSKVKSIKIPLSKKPRILADKDMTNFINLPVKISP